MSLRVGAVLLAWSVVALAPLTTGGVGSARAASGTTIMAVTGQPFTGDVGTIAVTAGTVCPCRLASIDWGDGTPADTSVTVSPNAGSGPQTLSGSHTYAKAGTYTTMVSLSGQSAAGSAVVSDAAPPPPPPGAGTDGPKAIFAVPSTYVLGGESVSFDGSASTVAQGAGPLTYRWTFCPTPARANPCPPGSPGADGADAMHAFSFAPVHDIARFPGGVDHTRRRSSYPVELTVTDKLGRSDTALKFVTVLPDTPPKAGFTIAASKPSLAPAPLLAAANNVTITPQASDPDGPNQIVAEAWDLNGDGLPDWYCAAFKACSTTPIEGFDVGGPNVLKSLSITSRANGAAQFCGQCNAPAADAFPPFQYNFLDAELKRQGLFPRLGAPDPAHPLPTDPTALAGFLRSYSNEVRVHTAAGGRGLYVPADSTGVTGLDKNGYPTAEDSYPREITMWARDAEGLIDKLTQPVAILADTSPSSAFSFIPDPAKPTIQTTDNIHLDFSATHDPDGSVSAYAMDFGQPPKSDQLPCSGGSTPDKTTGKKDFQNTDPPHISPPPLFFKHGPPAPLSRDQLLAGANFNAACFVLTPLITPEPGWPIVSATPDALDNQNFKNVPDNPPVRSIRLTVFDDVGLASTTRIDGFRVTAPGNCKQVTNKVILGPKDTEFGMSGDCVSEALTNTGSFFFSPDMIDINGLQLLPAPGAGIVIDDRNREKPLIYATTKLTGVDLTFPEKLTPEAKKAKLDQLASLIGFNINASNSAAVSVRLNDQSIATIKAFDTDVGSALTNHEIVGDGVIAVATTATYNDLPIAPHSVNVQLDSTSGSTIKLSPQLPPAFTDSQGQGPTVDPIPITAKDVPIQQTLSSKTAQSASVHAHASGPAPPTVTAPADTTLGGVPLTGTPPTFTYDKATDRWSGDVQMMIPGLDQIGAVQLHLIFRGASLLSGAGSATLQNGGVPVFPSIFATKVDFSIATNPLVLSAGVTLTAAGFLAGTGTLTVVPSKTDVRFDGNLNLLGFLPLGGASVESNGTSLEFKGSTGASFGPASFSASVDGQFDKDGHFNVVGDGSACLFLCLQVQALASNKGVAACGEIDLLLASIRAGFGVESGGSVHLYGGSCDVNDYHQDVKPAKASAADAQCPVLACPGHTTTVKVPGNKRFVAIAVHAAAGSAVAPHVSLVAPNASTIGSPSQTGDYTFGSSESTLLNKKATLPLAPTAKPGTTLVDENPLNATTTIMIAKPQGGVWTVKVAPDSPPVVAVQIAASLPQIPPVGALVGGVPAGEMPPAGSIVGAPVALLGAQASSASRAPIRTRSILPPIERPRLRRLRFALPPGLGSVSFIERSTQGGLLLGTATSQRRHGTIVFDPPPVAGTHKIIALFSAPNGLPRAARTVATFVVPAAPTPARPSIVGMLRRADSAVLLLAHEPSDTDPQAVAFLVNGTTSTGRILSLGVRTAEVRHIAGHPAIVLANIPRAAQLNVEVRARYHMRDGAPRRAVSLKRKH